VAQYLGLFKEMDGVFDTCRRRRQGGEKLDERHAAADRHPKGTA
jgi:hypothetical protein